MIHCRPWVSFCACNCIIQSLLIFTFDLLLALCEVMQVLEGARITIELTAQLLRTSMLKQAHLQYTRLAQVCSRLMHLTSTTTKGTTFPHKCRLLHCTNHECTYNWHSCHVPCCVMSYLRGSKILKLNVCLHHTRCGLDRSTTLHACFAGTTPPQASWRTQLCYKQGGACNCLFNRVIYIRLYSNGHHQQLCWLSPLQELAVTHCVIE